MPIRRILFLTPHKSLPAIVALPLLIFLLSTSAQTNQAPIDKERTLQVMKSPYMPADTTVAIVGIRNLQNEHWLRDLEIEVQNNSKKPICYLSMVLSFPDIPKTTELDNIERGLVISLRFGRTALANRGQRATVQDPSISPGEKYVFVAKQEQYRGFESHLSRHNLPPSVTKKVRLRFDSLRFDDGSGLNYGGLHKYESSTSSPPNNRE